jgi:hypothetical protein
VKTRLSAALFTVAAAFAGATPPLAAQAQPTTSVMQLLSALPELPATAQDATSWVDKHGKLMHAPLLALETALSAHRQAVDQIALANAHAQQEQGAVTTQGLMQGMADAGIDVQRLQTDPAYQREVQERLRRMTPEQQMAFAQRMNAPVNRDPRHINAAQAMANDAPAARAAAEAGQAYAQAQPARAMAQHALWQQTEEAVKAVLAKRLVVAAPKPKMEWDNIGCDKACQAAWDSYAAQMLPLMIARDTEILRIRRAALAKHRALVLAELKTADSHLVATRYGLGSTSHLNQRTIVGYDGAALAEIEALIVRMQDIVKSAAITAHCGKQIVLVPGAVCS